MTRPPSESPGTPWAAWTAAFILAVGLGGVAVAATWIAARTSTVAAAGAAGLVTLLLLVVLVGILIHQRAGLTRARQAIAELNERAHMVGAQAVVRGSENQQLANQLQRCISQLEQQKDRRRADLAARSAALENALDQLVRIQLPLVFSGSAVPPLSADAAGGDGQVAALCGEVLAAVASGTAQLHQELDEDRESARLAVVALARRVQASAHRIQEEATRMAQRHSADPDVLESSMRVDHAAAQQARHAQSMAVLSGEWPGQQWSEPLALIDVARAAAGRILPYQRVSVSGDPDVAVAARAVEPLIHLVAELLANATQSSPPASQVLVTVRPVQRGAVIEVDDGGVGMDEHRLEQAREIACGRVPADLTSLGEIPQTGLAVVGQYARRHGFGVDLMPSPYGGIRVVTLVPAELVQVADPGGTVPVRRRARLPAALESGPSPAAGTGLGMPESAGYEPAPQPVTELRPVRRVAAQREGDHQPAPEYRPAAHPAAQHQGAQQPGGERWPSGPRHANYERVQVRDAGPAREDAAPAIPVPAVPAPQAAPEDNEPRAGEVAATEVTAAGLPRRRARRTDPALATTQYLTPASTAAARAAARAAADEPSDASPADAGAWMGAFLGGGRPAEGRPGGGGARRRQHG